jgi:hypothetical protein
MTEVLYYPGKGIQPSAYFRVPASSLPYVTTATDFRYKKQSDPDSSFTSWVTYTVGQSLHIVNRTGVDIVYVMEVRAYNRIGGSILTDTIITATFYFTVAPTPDIIAPIEITIPGDTHRFLLEDGSGYLQLENGSYLLLETAP